MKIFTLAVVITMDYVMPINVMAVSTVEKPIAVKHSLNNDNVTVAIGKENIASTGSVNVKDSKVKNALIYNKLINTGNATIAVGEITP